ncbi:hypothetical protein LIER_01175 [Lithospermum erythrorhizon]|uniref:Uncharacterized protein n=1 Tax=Lithospermum erythrorhizon TaxID=34254 RepID=A0AAV3NL66_LITER
MKARSVGWRQRRKVTVYCFLIASVFMTGIGLLLLSLTAIDIPIGHLKDHLHHKDLQGEAQQQNKVKNCATVEEMGGNFHSGFMKESLRVREMIQHHFTNNGAERVRELSPEEFCRHGFVLGKASEAGLGNEMYKILTGAALSIMLNRSLIIGQTRGKYPFGDYLTYSNVSFTLSEVKHLWRTNGCLTKYGRHLHIRVDDFQKPAKTNVLCGNWKEWEQPIIWFQNATDAVPAQFFLKNIHPEMAKAAADLFGRSEDLSYRPNVFGELMRLLVTPSEEVEKAVNWALGGGSDPDIVLHMRMLMNRSVRAVQAALNCIEKAVQNLPLISRPKVVIVSDTPHVVEDVALRLNEFAEVVHFDFKHFGGNMSGMISKPSNSNIRVKDWGPAPRWVAFVDFFLASRAKHAVISGAHRRVGTTYAQLISALAAAHRLGDYTASGSNFTFLSSFQSNLLSEGLKNQVGWGHAWNRFAGSLSCPNQSNQCALTPLLPPGWWDGMWQSPLPRDIHRMEAYGVKLSGFGTFDHEQLRSFCSTKREFVKKIPLI